MQHMRSLLLSLVLLPLVAACGDTASTPTDPTPVSTGTPRLTLSAQPGAVPLTGGTVRVSIRARRGETPAANMAVQLDTTSGTLSQRLVMTDQSGTAEVTLTTTEETLVTASAEVGTVQLVVPAKAPFTITLTGDVRITANQTWQGRVTVRLAPDLVSPPIPAGVRITCGDGTSNTLGSGVHEASLVECVYRTPGIYQVTATATKDAWSTSASMGVQVVEATAPTPPGVTISTVVRGNSSGNFPVDFRLLVDGDGRRIQRVQWDFGDGEQITTEGGGVTTTHIYRTADRYRITAVVDTLDGRVTARTEIDINE